MHRQKVTHVSLLLAACVLSACAARTDVSATANVTALYSHVWITVQDVKFNASATAAADESGWLDFPLSTPQTIDLAAVSNGGLALFASALKIPTGSYAQMQLILADTSATLATSAQSAGLLYNDQVDYLDSTGAAVAAPLQLVHPEQGIIVAVSLTDPTDRRRRSPRSAQSLPTTATTSGAATTTIDPTTGLPTTRPARATTAAIATTATCQSDNHQHHHTGYDHDRQLHAIDNAYGLAGHRLRRRTRPSPVYL